MRELAELEINEHEAAEQAVVEDEVDVEVIALERHALLPRDEAEALAQLEEEAFDAIDDRLLEIALAPVRPLVEPEELEHERVLHHVGRHLDLVSAPSEREDLLLVAALRQPLEEERRDLPLQLAACPALARRLDLVERARCRVRDPHEEQVVGPPEVWRKGRGHAGRFGQRRCPNISARFARHCRANLRRRRNARQRRAFLGATRPAAKRPGQRRPLGVREVELPHVAEVRDAEALANSTRQPLREPLDHARAIASALLAVLLDLDDLAPDEPVRTVAVLTERAT